MLKNVLLCFLLTVLLSCTEWAEPLPLSQAARNFRLASCNLASVTRNEDFEGATVPAHFTTVSTEKSGVSLTTEKKLAGLQSLRFRLASTSSGGPTPVLRRSELIHYPINTDTSEIWCGFSQYMPSATMQNGSNPVLFMYWSASYYGHKGGYSYQNPIIALVLHPNNSVQVSYLSTSQAPTKAAQLVTTPATSRTLGKMVFDQWVDYVIHIRFNPITRKGMLQIWQDGVAVLNEQHIRLGYKDGIPFWRFGLLTYASGPVHKEQIAYVDQIRLGNQHACYDAVAPANARNVYKPMKP